MRVGEIAAEIGLRHASVSYHIKRYVENGGFLMANPMKMQKVRGPVKMTK